jgi:hypothetical protein
MPTGVETSPYEDSCSALLLIFCSNVSYEEFRIAAFRFLAEARPSASVGRVWLVVSTRLCLSCQTSSVGRTVKLARRVRSMLLPPTKPNSAMPLKPGKSNVPKVEAVVSAVAAILGPDIGFHFSVWQDRTRKPSPCSSSDPHPALSRREG